MTRKKPPKKKQLTNSQNHDNYFLKTDKSKMGLTHETTPSSMPELPWRFKAFGRLAATEQVFREKYKEDIDWKQREGRGLYISFGMKDGPIKVSGLSIPGATAVDLLGIRYPDSGGIENSDPLIHLGFSAFSEDGSYIGVSGETQEDSPLKGVCSAFFGSEMPPFMVGLEDYCVAKDVNTLPDGSVVRNAPGETILRLDNKLLLTDRDCEILTGLVETDTDNTGFV